MYVMGLYPSNRLPGDVKPLGNGRVTGNLGININNLFNDIHW